jgi:hypothetical protein
VKTRILLVMAFLTPFAGWAADPVPLDVKLGLWETTIANQSDMSAMLPPEMLAKLTPAQRAQLEAGRQGRGGRGMSASKHCVTKETINEAFAAGNRGYAREMKCTQTFVTATSSKMVMHMECTSETMKTSSDIQVEAIDREHTKGSIVTTSAGGRSGNMKMEMTSKWLGPDCGDVGQKKN